MSESKEDPNELTRRNSDVMIARIDERTENLSKQLEAVWKEVRAATDKMSKEIRDANVEAAKLVKEHTDHDALTYVTKEEFNPVKIIAFSLVGFACIAVLAAVVALVIRTPDGAHFEVSTPNGTHVAVDPYHFPGEGKNGTHR